MTCVDLSFYKGKRVLITGHTGFKGSWLCKILLDAGAKVTGYSRCSEKGIRLFDLANLSANIETVQGDIRDLEKLKQVFQKIQPEIVFHLAAQPIVRESYINPVTTYETNVMGTVNLLECVRLNPCVRSVLNVTTDKVYLNREWPWGYREAELLDGFDPYSNSKSCSELVTHSYYNSFLKESNTAVSTARAGNVIGGGDFAKDRIIPDCVRAVVKGEPIIVRNPNSIRPYQHVLEPLMVYLMIAQKQYENKQVEGNYNVGPDDCDCLTTGALVDLFCRKWGEGATWINRAEDNAPHEANCLKLDCSKLKAIFQWQPRWHTEEAMEQICRWNKVWLYGGEISKEMGREIQDFLE